MGEHLNPYEVGAAIRLNAREVGAGICLHASDLAAALMSNGLTIDGREVANQLAQTGALNGLAEQLAPLIADALRPADDAALLLRALWTGKAQRHVDMQEPSPETGVRIGWKFYPHAAFDAPLSVELREALRNVFAAVDGPAPLAGSLPPQDREVDLRRAVTVALIDLAYHDEEVATQPGEVNVASCGGCGSAAYRENSRWIADGHVLAPRWGLPGGACPVAIAESGARQ